MKLTKLKRGLRKAGLTGLSADILRFAKPSIRLTSHRVDEQIIEIGISQIGGAPDLPEGIEWPDWKGAPMSFIAQIRLEETAPCDPQKVLPRSGLLIFFYDSRQETYGADPDDRGGWQVFYDSSDPDRWQPRRAPSALPASASFSRCRLTASCEITLPSAPRQYCPDLDWTQDDVKQYEQFLARFPDPDDHARVHNRMLGYPDQLQDDMQLQCALASNGIRGLDDPRAAAAIAEKNDWLLLFQVDSDENAGMRWGSAGMIYYWIKTQDLKNGAFDHTWLVLQSD